MQGETLCARVQYPTQQQHHEARSQVAHILHARCRSQIIPRGHYVEQSAATHVQYQKCAQATCSKQSTLLYVEQPPNMLQHIAISCSIAAPLPSMPCYKDCFTGTAHVLVRCMQGDCNPGRMPASSHGADSQCSAPQPALPGHPQQRRTLPAHCAGLLSCQCLDQRLPGQYYILNALHLQLTILHMLNALHVQLTLS